MNYAIFRSEPVNTMNDLAQIGSHNKREKKVYKSNPDIDLNKTKDNVELVPLNMKYTKGFYELTKDYRKEHEERMKTERTDRQKTFRQMLDKSKSVVADELMFTATHTFFKDMSKEEIVRWAQTCMVFVTEKLGYKENQILHATLHMDEKTPHVHCVVVPLVKKFDKRTNTERYTISKKQYIRDKEHLSELQDQYCELLNTMGFALERGIKHSDREHIDIKEFKKLTRALANEIKVDDDTLDKAIKELEIKMKSNKVVMFDKDSVKVRKDTFDSMNKVIDESKKVKDLKSKLDTAYSNLKTVTDNYSNMHKENMKLDKENNDLKYKYNDLKYNESYLNYNIKRLKSVIDGMSDFVYHLVADGLVPSSVEDEFNDEFEEFISGKKKREDDLFV